jgi:hypothetical protein
MKQDTSDWQDGLAADLKRIYTSGLREDAEPETVPVLAELAVELCNEPYRGEKDYYSLVIADLLRRAIGRAEPTKKRRRGFEMLLGIAGAENELGLEDRREHAVPYFPQYSNKDSLRRGEVGGQPFEQIVRERIVRQMLALAGEDGFVYKARYAGPKDTRDDEATSDVADDGSSSRSATPEEPPVRPPQPLESPPPAFPAQPSQSPGSSHSTAGRRRAILAVLICLGLVGAAAILVAVGAFSSVRQRVEIWGPARPLYDYRRYNGNNDCADPTNPATDYGRCGAITTYPVFNSFIHTPFYGDERAFFDGRRGDQSQHEYGDPIQDVASGDKTVVLRIYIDNMAQVYEKEPELTTAYNTRIRVALPSIAGKSLIAYAYISADHTITVYDSAVLTASQSFTLEYIPGSTVLWVNGRHAPYHPSNEIIGSEGALIGVKGTNGVFPPSGWAQAIVELKVRVVPQ